MTPITRGPGLTGWAAALPMRLVGAAGGAVARFPFAVLCLLAATLLANAWIAGYATLPDDAQTRLLIAMSVALFWSLAVSVAGETRPGEADARAPGATWRTRLLASGVGVGAGCLAWFYRPFEGAGSVMQGLALLALFVLPFARRPDPIDLWNFLLRSLAAFGLAFVAVLTFVSGMVLLVELFRLLFSIGPDPDAYAHVYTTALLLVGPMATLGLAPAAEPGFEPNQAHAAQAGARMAGPRMASPRMARLVRGFLAWVAVPLLLAALAVLHLYAVRAVLTGEMAERDMVWIVPLLLFDIVVVRFLAAPLEGAACPPHVGFFRRFWPLALPVPLLMFAMAIPASAMRGWTFELYFASLLAIVVAILGLLQAFARSRGDLRWFLALPALALALSLFGPWGAGAVVSRPAPWSPSIVPPVTFAEYQAPLGKALPASGFDLLLPDVGVGTEPSPASSDFSVGFEATMLVVAGPSRTLRFDLAPVLDAVAGKAQAPLRGELATEAGQRIFYDIRYLRTQDNVPLTGRMTLLLRAADWR